MPMSPDHRRTLSHAMRRQADDTTCPTCRRRAALVIHLDPTTGRHHTECHWARRGLCSYTPLGAR